MKGRSKFGRASSTCRDVERLDVSDRVEVSTQDIRLLWSLVCGFV